MRSKSCTDRVPSRVLDTRKRLPPGSVVPNRNAGVVLIPRDLSSSLRSRMSVVVAVERRHAWNAVSSIPGIAILDNRASDSTLEKSKLISRS